MENKCVITRVHDRLISAEFQDSKCCDLHVFEESSIVNNIYVGRVENVVKNINSAFIEIQKGVKCYYSLEDNKKHIFLNRKNSDKVNIGDLMLVQVIREPIKTKPATATSKIAMNGRYLVISSDIKGIAISAKVKKNEHCRELRDIFNEHMEQWLADCNREFGFILRTNSANADIQDVLGEADSLMKQFCDILSKAEFAKAFTLMYKAPAGYIDKIKGIRGNSATEIITDDPDIYEEINMALSNQNASSSCTAALAASTITARLYSDNLLSLQSLYSLETEISRALAKKVWLKSGGYIVIEQTEALTVIDVNTGKQVSKKSGVDAKESTVAKANMEAAREIARQMRLRNLSGIIIVDFINMEDDKNNSELMSCLRNLLRHDTLQSSVIDITKLGLVEMTRKKSGKSLYEAWQGGSKAVTE